ncbi:class I SAM-dependent methyltransferase [Flocculibacter collagenilyticus]|uniref:class I SAM-dependent methyltransferase n=1 Tax=Flocculibacter collagenilyticus TaxID=2744479 RepID=UPI0018F2C98A|nr:class I SAM-dependent methyltransferase [Flocculibacter collagenilyticus]
MFNRSEPNLSCPLCAHFTVTPFHQDKKREYLRCVQCALVFVPAQFHLSAEDEKAEYDKHENDVTDSGYVNFLQRAANPLLERLSTVSTRLSGLDFGCGPAPALAELLQAAGHNVALYDYYYHPDNAVLSRQYDFVTCTEVIEHFNQPAEGWAQLLSLLKPQGHLVIMTKLVIDEARFSQWHYKNDPTHVSFFSRETFDFLADKHHLSVEYVGNDVILFQSRTG